MSARVLIVDDDLELAQMLTEYLAGEGYETTVATVCQRASQTRQVSNPGKRP